MQGKYCQHTGNFTRSYSEEARLWKESTVWSRAGSTAETSSEMMHTVLAICSQERRIDNTRIGAQMNYKKDSGIGSLAK